MYLITILLYSFLISNMINSFKLKLNINKLLLIHLLLNLMLIDIYYISFYISPFYVVYKHNKNIKYIIVKNITNPIKSPINSNI